MMNREVLDTLPSARTYVTFGAVVPGVKMTKPDIGGTGVFFQAYLRARGKTTWQNAFDIDGLDLRSPRDAAGNTSYTNFAMAQDVVVQTSAISAETSGGGVRINMIPREGGNTFRGEGIRQRHALKLAEQQHHTRIDQPGSGEAGCDRHAVRTEPCRGWAGRSRSRLVLLVAADQSNDSGAGRRPLRGREPGIQQGDGDRCFGAIDVAGEPAEQSSATTIDPGRANRTLRGALRSPEGL